MLDTNLYEALARLRHALRQVLAFSETVTHVIMIEGLADQIFLYNDSAVQLVGRFINAFLVVRKYLRTASSVWKWQ